MFTQKKTQKKEIKILGTEPAIRRKGHSPFLGKIQFLIRNCHNWEEAIYCSIDRAGSFQ